MADSVSGVVILHSEAGLLIRRCTPSDLETVLLIERESYPRPWTEQHFLQELQAPYSSLDLLLFKDIIAGYICYWLTSAEMHILNVSTAPAFRRRGVARNLLEHVFIQANTACAELACLEVRTGNHGAISLYRSFGFTDDCIRRRYYQNGDDALLMSCVLDSAGNKE